MPKQNIDLESAPAAVTDMVERLGSNINTARLRRRWTMEEMATKAGLSKETVARVEAGRLTTGIGAYVAVLWALGLHRTLEGVAPPEADEEGLVLAAARLGERARPQRTIDDDF